MSACIIIIYILCVILLTIAIYLLYIGIVDTIDIPDNKGYLTTSGVIVSCTSEPYGWGIFKKYNTMVDYNVTMNGKTFGATTYMKTRDGSLCNIYNSPTYKLKVYYDPNNIELTTLINENESKQIEIIKIVSGCILIIIILMLLIFKNKICDLFE